MQAYHFVGKTLRDGRPVPPDGEWLEHKGPLELCDSGLHASKHPFDALQYAPGTTLCLVEIEGKVIEGNDQVCATRRKIIKRIDATELLYKFAREQALSVIHLWDAPDVVRRYLETGDETLREAARAAALAAAGAAVAAAMAARAARAAARGAARAAAWDAAVAAAVAAGAAGDAARQRFKELVDEAFAVI